MKFTKVYSEMLRENIRAKVSDLSPVTSDRPTTLMEMYEKFAMSDIGGHYSLLTAEHVLSVVYYGFCYTLL